MGLRDVPRGQPTPSQHGRSERKSNGQTKGMIDDPFSDYEKGAWATKSRKDLFQGNVRVDS